MFLLSHWCSPLLTLLVTLLSVVLYPQHSYTPSRGETLLLTSACWGAHTGAWLSYQLGHLTNQNQALEHVISDEPIRDQLVAGVLRQVLGNIIMAVIYFTVKPLSRHTAAFLVNTDLNTLSLQEFHLSNKKKIFVDLFAKVTVLHLIENYLIKIISVCDILSDWSLCNNSLSSHSTLLQL